jgi:PII-like signaling protein
MNIPEDGYLLRVFIGESDKFGHRPLYEEIVLKAREAGLAGPLVAPRVRRSRFDSLIRDC